MPSRPPSSNGFTRPDAYTASTARSRRSGVARQRLDAELGGEPVEHHRRGEDRRRRVRLALAGDVGRRAVARLEQPVRVADVGRRRHAHAADQPRGQVGQDVAEHVLGDHHVVVPGLADHVERGRVDVVVPRLDVGKARGALVEDLAEERHRAEHVRLVDAGHAPRAPARLAPPREAEGEVVDALGARAGDDHRVLRLAVLDQDPLAARGEQALGRLADDDQIDPRRARIGERQRDAGNRPRRAHAGVERQLDAQVELRRDLGAVGIADFGPPHGAEEHGVGGARGGERARRQGDAGGLVVQRAGRVRGEAERIGRVVRQLLEQRHGGVDHLRADAVPGEDGDVEQAGCGCGRHGVLTGS